jgi:hypothetical protein
MKSIITSAALCTLLFSASVHAQVDPNATIFTNINPYGIPPYGGNGLIDAASSDGTGSGIAFTSPGAMLTDFHFYAAYGGSRDITLTIAEWDLYNPVGRALYTSPPIAYSGGSQAVGASNINLMLWKDTRYIAFISSAGLANSTEPIALWMAMDDAKLSDYYVRQKYNGSAPLTPGQEWVPDAWFHLIYTAQFSGNIGQVPEPATYGMLLAGLGLVGFAARRRAKQA